MISMRGCICVDIGRAYSTTSGRRANRKHWTVNWLNMSVMSTLRLLAVAMAWSNWFACANLRSPHTTSWHHMMILFWRPILCFMPKIPQQAAFLFCFVLFFCHDSGGFCTDAFSFVMTVMRERMGGSLLLRHGHGDAMVTILEWQGWLDFSRIMGLMSIYVARSMGTWLYEGWHVCLASNPDRQEPEGGGFSRGFS